MHATTIAKIEAGDRTKVVHRLLGHQSAALTLDRYGHLLPNDLDAVADAVDAAVQTAAGALRAMEPIRNQAPRKGVSAG